MGPRLARARASAQSSSAATLAELIDWLRIPSISGDRRHRGDLARAAQWVADRIRAMTPAVTVVPSPSGPVVLARITGRDPQLSAIVVYGHFDVRPPGTGWDTAPFEPARKGDRLIARGASDDKGQLMAHLAALAAWHRVGGPPCDVLLVVDGAEEIGSPDLSGLLRRWRTRTLLAGPVSAVIVSDTRGDERGHPSVTVSQRGMLSLRVAVETGGIPVHAGRFGGAVVDPTLVLAGAVQRVASWAGSLRSPCAVSVRGVVRRPFAGQRAVYGGDLGARTTVRGTLTVNSIRAAAAPGSIPTLAEALLDVRLPPGMASVSAERALARRLRHACPAGVSVTVSRLGRADGLCMTVDDRTIKAAGEACRAGFGAPPVHMSSGGSIPAAAFLQDAFSTTPLLLGFGAHNDGAHGPNEYLNLRSWLRAIDTSTNLIATIALRHGPGQRQSRARRDDRRQANHGFGSAEASTLETQDDSEDHWSGRFSNNGVGQIRTSEAHLGEGHHA